jgi:hypothetical protein
LLNHATNPPATSSPAPRLSSLFAPAPTPADPLPPPGRRAAARRDPEIIGHNGCLAPGPLRAAAPAKR